MFLQTENSIQKFMKDAAATAQEACGNGYTPDQASRYCCCPDEADKSSNHPWCAKRYVTFPRFTIRGHRSTAVHSDRSDVGS